jgi:hypothetical protein
MKRKWLAVGLILLSVMVNIVPANAKPLIGATQPLPLGKFFGLNSHLEISWDANQTEKPIIPRGELRTVDLHMKFWTTWGVFGRLINYFLSYKLVEMKLSIIQTPAFCTANIAVDTLSLTIPPKENTYETVSSSMMVQVADGAPAFELFPVTIQAKIKPLYAPLGLILLMHGTTNVSNVTFTVAYKPILSPRLPEGNIIEAPPYVQVQLPIGITNLGNGKTIVENEVINFPDGWLVTLPDQLVLEVGEYKEMNLSIISSYDFPNEQVIRISLTPHSYENYSLVGTTIYETILAYYQPP